MRVPVVLASLALAVSPFVAVAPAAAESPPLTITADMPSAVPGGHNWGFNDFFPRSLSVAAGSTIQFSTAGFHTETLLPAGTTDAQDLLANGLIKADADDTAANPNGTSHSQFFVPAVLPVPGTCGGASNPCTFDGTSVLSSGASLGAPLGPFVVHVTAAPGIYAFHCRIHPGMQGSLRVLPAGSQGTTAAELTSAVAAQVAADVVAGTVAEAKAQNATPRRNADGTKTWTMTAGTSSPDGHVAVLEMLPRNLHLRSGDTVVWRPLSPNEPHTVTFPGELNSDIVPLCEAASGDTLAVPLHLPPQGPFDFSCGGRPFPDELELGGGNGNATVTSPTSISDSGIVSSVQEPTSFGVPPTISLRSWSVRFAGAAAGSYHYVCQIHQGMEGQITVIPGA